MKTKLLYLFAFFLSSLGLTAQTNAITVTSTIPSSIEIGQTITVDYEYTLAANPTDQQIKVGFNEVDSGGGYVSSGDAQYSGGLGIGATTSVQTGSLTFTVNSPASSTLPSGNKYVIDVVIQANASPWTIYASAAENGTELTVNEASGVINSITVTSTLPSTATQGETITVGVDYSITEAGKIQIGLEDRGTDDMSDEWSWNGWLVDAYFDVPITDSGNETVTFMVPSDARLSSSFTGHRRYRLTVNLLDNSYATLATISNSVNPFTVTASLSLKDVNTDGIAIYPNPVSDKLMINAVRLQANQIRLSDVMGRTVRFIEDAKNVNSIDVSSLSKGLYVLSTDNKKQFKFIKE